MVTVESMNKAAMFVIAMNVKLKIFAIFCYEMGKHESLLRWLLERISIRCKF
jgi:hypothetical protein